MTDRKPVGTAGARRQRVIWVNRFFHPDESATSIMLTDLVRALAADTRGPHHHLVTSNARYAGGDGAASLPVPGVAVHRIPALGSNNASLALRLVNFVLFYSFALVHLLRHARRGDVIVALTDPPLIGTIAAVAAAIKRARLVHWVQDIFPETASRLGFARQGGWTESLLLALRNLGWKRADGSVVIGQRMAAFLEGHGVPASRVTVIQNWAGDEAIRPVAPADNPLRAQWGYAAGDCVIGYSGNLGRAHEVATKVEAMRLLREGGAGSRRRARVRFLFIGGGARQEELRRAALDWDEQFLAFRPYQPMAMLAESLSVPDVHWISLQPQLEGLIVPSKLYGALAAGRPVVFIGDPQGEVARLVAEGECGASFAPGDSVALAEYLLRLAGDARLRARLGRNARSYLETALARQQRLGEWQDLLSGLAAR